MVFNTGQLRQLRDDIVTSAAMQDHWKSGAVLPTGTTYRDLFLTRIKKDEALLHLFYNFN